MKKYKLINTKTKEEHLCEKVTINGFEYYIVDEEPSLYDTLMGCYYIFKKTLYKRELNHHTGCKKVIATNNPNIDISKVVNEIERLTFQEFKDWSFGEHGPWHTYKMFQKGYSKSQETHPNSDEDMIEFAEWCQKPCLEDLRQPNVVYISSGNFYWYKHKKYTPKELLQLWKEQQTKIIYYE